MSDHRTSMDIQVRGLRKVYGEVVAVDGGFARSYF